MKGESLAHKVYGELRKKILSNQLTAGTRLKEDAWARKMNVSRMAVREALTRLMGEKLLTLGERGGFFIKSITSDDVREIRQLREVLEIGALRLACVAITPVQIQKLEHICEDFTVMVRGGYLNGACEADIKFHETLIDSANNEKLKEIYLSSNIPLFHFKLGKILTETSDYEQTDTEHRLILSAIKNGDFKQAEETLINHLNRAEAALFDWE